MESFRTLTAFAVPALGLAATLWGLVNARRTASVVTVDVPIAGLPAELQGFTIAQISDIHVGPTIKQRYLQEIVNAVNALEPDLVAVTGDLVDGSVGWGACGSTSAGARAIGARPSGWARPPRSQG